MVFANVLVSGSFSFRGIIIGFYNPNPTQPLAKDSYNYMPYSFRIVCEFFNVPHNMEDICETFIVLIREDLKVLPFADLITKAALSTQLFFFFFNFFHFLLSY